MFFNSWVSEHYTSTRTQTLENQFATISTSSTLFFIEAPDLVVFAKGNPYYQFFAPTDDIQFGKEELSLLTQNIPDIVIVPQVRLLQFSDQLTHYTTFSTSTGYLFLKRNTKS